MNLASYIEGLGISVAEFGRLIDVPNRQTVHKYVRGERFPPPATLARIREVTGGRVTADDFVAQHTAPSAAERAAA